MTIHLSARAETGAWAPLDPGFKFDSLTSLRGIAALCTILIHLVAIWASAFPAMRNWPLFRQFSLHSYLFVDFFFILSGFVMSHAYGKTFKAGVSRSGFRRFMQARFARVYPLHFVLLVLYVGLASIGIKQDQPNPDWSITANVLLVHAMGFFATPTWNQPSWSISVEWCTYLLFPFVLPLAKRYLRGAAAVVGLVAAIVMFAMLTRRFGSADLTVGFAFVRCLIGFFAGMCLYEIVLARRLALPVNLMSAVILLALAASMAYVPSPVLDVVAFMGFCLLVCVTSKERTQREWLRKPVLIWAGDISYSIYLWHTLMLHVFAKLILKFKGSEVWSADRQVVYFVIALALFEAAILLLAHLSYTWIEVPARNFLSPKKVPATLPADTVGARLSA